MRECRCTPGQIQRYVGRVSGPLLDRIDIHVEVPTVPYRELTGKQSGTSSAKMQEQVTSLASKQDKSFKLSYRQR